MASLTGKTYTVRQAAETLGLSQAIVRRHCQEGKCVSEYHEFPGTQRGYYLLSEQALRWLREHVQPRGKSEE